MEPKIVRFDLGKEYIILTSALYPEGITKFVVFSLIKVIVVVTLGEM